MSSTNRGAERIEADYYRTPEAPIREFLYAWIQDCPEVSTLLTAGTARILDPCAGGNVRPVEWLFKKGKDGKPDTIFHIPVSRMPYPAVLEDVFKGRHKIDTIDIREDSPAAIHGDFLTMPVPEKEEYDLSISNPPFLNAISFITRSVQWVKPGGYVVMLLRLNFFGSDDRFQFFKLIPPSYCYVHHKRMSFTPDGKSDSIEYAHMVWQKGEHPRFTKLRVI